MKSSTYDVTVNSLGFRGPENKRHKSRSAKRIAVLGGSSVFGYLVPEGQDSCRLLEAEFANNEVITEVVNAGVPGFNMTQCRYRFEDHVAPLDPDIVILYLGWNDSKFLTSNDPDSFNKTPPAPPLWKRALSHSVLYGFLGYRLFASSDPVFAPPSSSDTVVTDAGAETFRKDLLALIQSIRMSGATPVISTQLMASGENCLELSEFLGSTAEQIAANQRIGQWITQTMRETARQENIQLIDCAAKIPCVPNMLGDAIHLTKEGHQRVADVWASELASLLRISR